MPGDIQEKTPVAVREVHGAKPEDIYRVVSSIAVAGTLQHGDDDN